MPAGNPLGYFPPEIQQQLLGAMLNPMMGAAGMLAPALMGGAPAPMSFMGQSTTVPGAPVQVQQEARHALLQQQVAPQQQVAQPQQGGGKKAYTIKNKRNQDIVRWFGPGQQVPHGAVPAK